MPHLPSPLELGILSDVNGMDWKQELRHLHLDKRYYVAGNGDCKLSKQQLEGLCLALLAHSRTFQTSVEAPAGFSIKIPTSIEERYVGPCLTATEALIRSKENSAVADTYCGTSEIYTMKVDTVREGFFLGDGDGFGKTRTFAALVAEYNARGILYCLHVSGSSNEYNNVTRELKAILNARVKCYKEEDLKTFCKTARVKTPPAANSGKSYNKILKSHVLLLTYSDLANAEIFSSLQSWLGDDGGFDGLVSLWYLFVVILMYFIGVVVLKPNYIAYSLTSSAFARYGFPAFNALLRQNKRMTG